MVSSEIDSVSTIAVVVRNPNKHGITEIGQKLLQCCKTIRFYIAAVRIAKLSSKPRRVRGCDRASPESADHTRNSETCACCCSSRTEMAGRGDGCSEVWRQQLCLLRDDENDILWSSMRHSGTRDQAGGSEHSILSRAIFGFAEGEPWGDHRRSRRVGISGWCLLDFVPSRPAAAQTMDGGRRRRSCQLEDFIFLAGVERGSNP